MHYTSRVIQGIREQEHNGVRFLCRLGGGDKVVVTFSSFAPHGVDQNFNYLKDFINSDFTIISFLDRNMPLDDPRGTYYLDDYCGDNYISIINDIVLNILKEKNKSQVYLIGSSKGATAALLFGLEYDYCNIYILAPQCRIATYIKRRSSIILNYLTNNSDVIYSKLDNILISKINSINSFLPWNIHILCGVQDDYHVSELNIIDNAFVMNNINYEKIFVDGAHDMIAIKEYRDYIKNNISNNIVF